MTTITAKASPPVLNISLWVAQVLLAAAFGMAGVMKTFIPIPDLAAQMGWPGEMPSSLVRFIGISELLAAVGLLLPSLTRIRPALTVWAALGLVIVMVLAAGFHASRGEVNAVPMNLVFAALAGFVAWGRSKKAPIQAR